MVKRLAVFDFDHTIVDDNTDIVARKLLKNEQIPDSTKLLYRSSGWTVYMQEIFKLLHKYNISQTSVKHAIAQIPAVPSIPELIKTMVDKLYFDVIIISDSNSVFINDWLVANNLDKYVLSVFTNPAKYNDSGLLEIKMHHVQDSCKLSTINLCKGMIMEDFVKQQVDSGVVYNQIVYAGDGKNDFCPILRLSENDLACVREGYPCVDLVKQASTDNAKQKVRANVCVWKNGNDILRRIE